MYNSRNPDVFFCVGGDDSRDPHYETDVTLRDLFAIAALAGDSSIPGPSAPKLVAEKCYKLADAMLAERHK
jgi:hypothetical protein